MVTQLYRLDYSNDPDVPLWPSGATWTAQRIVLAPSIRCPGDVTERMFARDSVFVAFGQRVSVD